MVKEFQTELADWQTLPDDIDFMTSGWCYGRGGRNLRNDQWSISHTTADLTETLYVLPNFLSVMINRAYDKGHLEAQREMRKALGV